MAHLPLFRSDSYVEMVAICGRNSANAQAMASKYDIPTTFSDYRQMIAHAQLGLVCVQMGEYGAAHTAMQQMIQAYQLMA